jgi:hypothetical protein
VPTDTVSAHLHRLNWLLRARVVEAKLRELERAVKAGFDPNQPRIPAGSGRPSGRWTDGGGASGVGTQVAQNTPRSGRGSGQVRLRSGKLAAATPAQEARHAVAQARAEAAIRRVQELDPNWRPTPSLTETVEGEIAAAQAEAHEAEARSAELGRIGIGPGPFADESIPARGPARDFAPSERSEINRIGSRTGCRTCGTVVPGTPSGNFVPDHQPPSGQNPLSRPQRLYPHCLRCSLRQGGWIRGRGSQR